MKFDMLDVCRSPVPLPARRIATNCMQSCLSKADEGCPYYRIADDVGWRFPAREVTQSGKEIKVKRHDAATGMFTPARSCQLRVRASVV